MWNGAFSGMTKRFTDNFKIISISHDEIVGIVSVTIEFDKSPGEQYAFEIDADKFQNDKEWIGKEILRQLGE